MVTDGDIYGVVAVLSKYLTGLHTAKGHQMIEELEALVRDEFSEGIEAGGEMAYVAGQEQGYEEGLHDGYEASS